MSSHAIKGSAELGKAIRRRREGLLLTTEDAARLAGVETRTWVRYELGKPIRGDKVDGILRALRWKHLPEPDAYGKIVDDLPFDLEPEQPAPKSPEPPEPSDDAWSPYIEEHYGKFAAEYFAFGSDVVLDNAKMDLRSLRSCPRGTHLGRLPNSMLMDLLPERYLTRYDYEFVYEFARLTQMMRQHAKLGLPEINKPAQEVIIMAIWTEATCFYEAQGWSSEDRSSAEMLQEDILDDIDVYTFLYAQFPPMEVPYDYLFENWFKDLFNMS